MQRVIENSIDIARTPQQVFDYVTQPWRWHEWHPSSQGATASAEVMSAGETFDEVIRLQPLSPLPLTIRRQTHYRVDEAQPGVCWQVTGEANGGKLTIRYQFSDNGQGGTRFFRRLSYEVKGPLRLFDRLLYPRMCQLSRVALANLKEKLEQKSS